MYKLYIYTHRVLLHLMATGVTLQGLCDCDLLKEECEVFHSVSSIEVPLTISRVKHVQMLVKLRLCTIHVLCKSHHQRAVL